MFGIVDADCTDVECTFESGEWGEWGQCSETCSIGWRERIFWGKLPSGYVTQTKERQKCALLDINCEAIVEGTKSAQKNYFVYCIYV